MSIHNFFSNLFPQTSHANVMLDEQTQLHAHLQAYRLVGTTSFIEYAEWSSIFSRLRISSDLVGFFVIVMSLLSMRVKDCVYTVYPVSSLYSLLYMFSTRALSPISPTLIKMTATVTHARISHSSGFVIRFSPTNIAKYLTTWTLTVLDVLFLRKNKVFNKGRYSRNRQFYRTGVYWCLYINIIAMIGLYFWFYRFVMNFGYLWWLLYLSLASFVLAKSFNYQIILPQALLQSVRADLVFFSLLVTALATYPVDLFLTWVSRLTRLSTLTFVNVPHLLKSSFLWSAAYYVQAYFTTYPQILSIFKYTNVNYYVHSITLNYNRVFLASKKIDFFTAYVKMLMH